MDNTKEIIDALILGMREGREPEDIFQDEEVRTKIGDTMMPVVTKGEAVRIAHHIVYDLYDGHFPIDHLSVGDVCIDAFGCMPCIITNVDKSIHVLYFNGKTYKFKRSQERFFKKLDINVSGAFHNMLNNIKRIHGPEIQKTQKEVS